MNRIKETRAKRWGFYGRRTEIEKLKKRLDLDRKPAERCFDAFGIAGRRGIGKNELLAETVRRYGDLQDLLVVELPVKGGEHACLQALMSEINSSGVKHLLQDLPARGEHCMDAFRFADVVRHLLYKGLIVCLDEFHNVRETNLPSALKTMIDRLDSWDGRNLRRNGEPVPTGKLVCMGSHQQHFYRMVQSDQPLHGRIPVQTLLHPWRVPTLMAMAEEHGWMTRPGRFLTLWTAFGGMPRLWHRFVQDKDKTNLHVFPARAAETENEQKVEDRAWRQEFINAERTLLMNNRADWWDAKAFIELPELMRNIFIWMARHPNRKLQVGRVPKALRGDMMDTELHRTLTDLGWNHAMVRRQGRVVDYPSWVLSDNTTLFQTGVFQDLFEYGVMFQDDGGDVLPNEPIMALETLEGIMLERLTAGWLEAHPLTQWCETGVSPGERKGDIDVLARIGPGGDEDILVLGTAKRKPSDHVSDLDKFSRNIRHFEAWDNTEAKELTQLRRCHILISPEFGPGQTGLLVALTDRKGRKAPSPLLRMDIPAMARELWKGWPVMQMLLDAA